MSLFEDARAAGITVPTLGSIGRFIMSDKKITPTHCERCNDPFSMYASKGGTGYAVVRGEPNVSNCVCDECETRHDTYICYKCAGEDEKAHMRAHGRTILYLTNSPASTKKWSISNWPGTLEFTTTYVRTGRHNMAKFRYDVWFVFEGRVWHGVQYGANTQLLHCKATKRLAAASKAVAA